MLTTATPKTVLPRQILHPGYVRASNAIQTTHNEMTFSIICCSNALDVTKILRLNQA